MLLFISPIAFLLFGALNAQYDVPSDSIQCPGEGLYTAAHQTDCDKYYLCRNGTLTLENCPNGLLYGVQGAVYEFCVHNWKIDCQGRKAPGPISSPGCPWQWGIFEDEGAGQCATTYSECSWGNPERKYCEPKGLVYDERIKGCNWPDQVGCKGEDILGFKCPEADTGNRYWPYPRYAYSQDALITCVKGQPRLIHCGKDSYADQNSMTCIPYEKEKAN
ncbi:protein obstructor-E [Tetranychus urticae]|uniref:Chitin-binding type-2 domain-containing protein n=1 Tax=Tetranychus urticae TaxID=32264 RepID=T1KMF9_TETUR|nr:protein obstructor-E [Tetranychus urticae]